MDGSLFWILAIVTVILIIVVIVLVVETGRPDTQQGETPGSRTPLPGSQVPIVAQRFDICFGNECGPGLICTQIPGRNERRCLSVAGQGCVINADCASGLCQHTDETPNGICQAHPIPGQPSVGGTQIYCRQGESWVARVTVPSGLVFTRITGSWNRLLGISIQTNRVYIWNGASWQDISSGFVSPGTLVDGVIVNNEIWIVYRLSTGQTALYRIINNILTPVNAGTGGLQMTTSNQVIEIAEVAVHPGGDVFLVGRIPGGQTSIFRKSANTTTYQAITIGQNIFVVENKTPDTFAFSSGSSILLMGDISARQDNVVSPITDLVVTIEGHLWYISANQLYRNGQRITTPITINQTTRLLYSLMDGVCIFTPGA